MAFPSAPGSDGAARAPLRPLVWLAGALGIGTLLGLGWAEGSFLPVLPAMATAVALLLLGWLGARILHAPPWVAGVLALAFLRASGAALPRRGPPAPAQAVHALRSVPQAGIWRAEPGGRFGWIESFDRAAAQAPTLLYEPESAAPAEGTPVVALPGGEAIPWARGPAPAPNERVRRFAALAPLAVDELVRLDGDPRSFADLRARLADWRAAVGARVQRVEGEHSHGLLRALAIGDRADLAAERADLFARTGTSHLLAISGWHVSLFAALVILPLSRAALRGRRGLAVLALNAGLLGAFATLAGAEKPVLRATLALLLLQLGAWRPAGARGIPRRPDALSFLGLAFALECLLDPCGIRSLSLALTHAATLGLIVGTGALARALAPARERWEDVGLGPWSRVRARGMATLRGALAASLAAVLATLPLTWSTFGEFAPAGAILTLLALPPFTVLSLLAWLAALVPAGGLTAPAELAARALYACLELGDRLPATPLVLPPRPLLVLAGATGLAFLALHRPGVRRVAALAWGLVLLPWTAAPAGLEAHALEVGHGSAIVLRAPGLEALIFDGGSRDRGGVAALALLPLLARWDVGEVAIVLSHPDHDHASGLARLVERVPVAAWLGAVPPAGPWPPPRLGERFDLGRGALRWRTGCPELRATLLRGSDEEGNEGSRALLVEWRAQRLLLLGDAEDAGLAGLALEPGPLRLLLAPHHGADAPELGSLLGRASPAEVWVSASAPPAIAGELERRRISWHWTGRDGPLSLRLP